MFALLWRSPESPTRELVQNIPNSYFLGKIVMTSNYSYAAGIFHERCDLPINVNFLSVRVPVSLQSSVQSGIRTGNKLIPR